MIKRTFALLLVVGLISVFILPVNASGNIFPDVDSRASYAWAVETMKNLNVFEGDSNGNFNPNAGITRAEFCTTIFRAVTREKYAVGVMSEDFYDVPTSHWANGYISWAYQSGIINGYGNGKFGPSDAVTTEQAIKMAVCSVGCGDVAMSSGGYPDGYIRVAAAFGYLDGVEGTIGMPITRANIAVLLSNAFAESNPNVPAKPSSPSPVVAGAIQMTSDIPNGIYEIRSALNPDFHLYSGGSYKYDNVCIFDGHVSDAGHLRITRVADGYYKIGGSYSEWDRVLTDTSDTGLGEFTLRSDDYHEKYSEMWKFEPQSDGTYLIRNRMTGKYIDVVNAEAVYGNYVQTFERNELYRAQNWYLVPSARNN